MAARELARANWKQALSLICQIKFVKNLAEFEQIKEVLTTRFREAALVVFLGTSIENHQNFSLDLLSKLFDMEEKQIIRVISRQIVKRELIGVKIDLKEKQLKIDRDAFKFKESDHLSLSMLNKVDTLAETNERILQTLKSQQGHKERTQAELLAIKNKDLMYRSKRPQY